MNTIIDARMSAKFLRKTTVLFISTLLSTLPLYSFANDGDVIDIANTDESVIEAQAVKLNENTSEVIDNFSEIKNPEILDLESEKNSPQEIEKPSLTQRVMPVYGNWCGANHPKDMSLADEPIDLLDQACKKHDFCYENEGYLSCACDNDINQELIQGLNENKYGKSEAVFARSFHLYFNGSPCSGDHSTKVAPSRLLHNVVKKASDRTVDVITSLPVIGNKIEEKLSD